MTLFCYKPSCFSCVNDHVYGLVSMRIPRFANEKQEGLLGPVYMEVGNLRRMR